MRTLTPFLRRRPRRPRRPGTPPRLRARRGFTIAEMIMAIVMLTVGVLAVASSSAVTIGQMTFAKQQATAAALATDRMELFRSYNQCALLTNGTDNTRYGMTESWTFATIITSTTGQASRNLTYSVTYKQGTRIRTQTFRSDIPCR